MSAGSGWERDDVLRQTRDVLELVKWSVGDIATGDPRRRRAGVWNLLTYGTRVIDVLQTIRHIEPTFEVWYSRWKELMTSDPLVSYMAVKRHALTLDAQPSSPVDLVNPDDGSGPTWELELEMGANTPPGAVSIFFNDSLGGNGWEIKSSAGFVAKIYFDLPETSGVVTRVLFAAPPCEHLGQEIADKSVLHLAELYVEFLQTLVTDAEQAFRTS